ncbi:TPA: DUF536 domain-containing protein [Enterococcus faecalis]|uniref:DUF536 domain-containing protein n=1 Tax=Enterococcus faecalis TaxID=1351 RepID=UPI0029C90BC3|nr:DUF536 domain-containing protein [Enterococcus faecalis]EKO5651359.1 DUF536 domain-containing protein [Enterococcus faecalis]WPH53478.1 DUF536 domain-containing protein [Enterococcus faecalis]HBI2014916.1 DUF536 domain-containing protein [Enterococcus faecalis]
MAEKTIKELAEEFQVSKQAIRKKLSTDFRANHVQTVTRNGVQTLVVSEKGYILLKQAFLGGNHTANHVQTVTGNLANQNLAFSVLHEQLKEKDEQLKLMQKLLDQQQQLTLQSNKQIEKLQKQLQLTYEEAPEKETAAFSEKIRSIDKQPATEKKWWHFWQS